MAEWLLAEARTRKEHTLMSATTIRLQMVGHKLGTIQKYCEKLTDGSLAVTTTEATK